MTGTNGKTIDVTKNSDIILFDSSSNLDDLKKILNPDQTIISFDYESHKLLEQNDIVHEISDSYVNRDDLVNVQNNCYLFTRWFDDYRFTQLLDYGGINLGLFIQVELNYFLVSFVKKFVETERVFAKNTNASFISSPFLYDFIRSHTDLATSLNPFHSSQKFYYDNVRIPVKIGGHNFSLNISNNQFDKLKKIFESIFVAFFGPNRIDKTKKSTLIVEFDPIRYRKIFESLPNAPLNLVVFNRRRPTIWNIQSFSIIKNSGCGIITSDLLYDATVKDCIRSNSELFHTKIQSVWNFDDFFVSFFSINGMSFWKLLKPKFKDLLEKRISEIIPEIEITKRLFEKYTFDSVLLWSEIGLTEQIVVKLAKQFGIRVVLFQHGLFYDSDLDGAYNMNKFQGVYPIDADKYVLWGDVEKQHQIKRGTPVEKLVVLGSPLYDDVSVVPNKKLKNYVVLATSGPVKENALDLTVETIENNSKAIREICTVVTKLNKKLVIKLHPSQDEFDPTQLAKEVSSNVIVKKTGSITELAKYCDVFVMIDASTVLLDAHLLKKPVISVMVKDSDYGIPSVMSESCALTDIAGFEKILQRVLTDGDFRNSLIEKGTKYVDKYLANQGTSSKKLLEFLSSL